MKPRKLNKKGQIIYLVYIIFIATLIIFNIVIVYSLMHDMDVKIKYDMSNLRFNSVATRLIYSPNCLAYEGGYNSTLGERYRVYPGLIDIAKLDRASGCVSITHGFELYELDSNLTTKKIKTSTESCGGDWTKSGSFLVRIRETNGMIIPGITKICIRE